MDTEVKSYPELFFLRLVTCDVTLWRSGLPAQKLDPLLLGFWILMLGAPNALRSGCCSNWRCCPGSRCQNTRSSGPSDLLSLEGKHNKRPQCFLWHIKAGRGVIKPQPPRHQSLRFTAICIVSHSAFNLLKRYYAYKYIHADICIKPFLEQSAGLLSPVAPGGGSVGDIFTLPVHSSCMQYK